MNENKHFYEITWNDESKVADQKVTNIEYLGDDTREVFDFGTECLLILDDDNKIVKSKLFDGLAHDGKVMGNSMTVAFKEKLPDEYFEAINKGKLELSWM